MGLISLSQVKRTDPCLLVCMENHYSAPKGFVGRNLCYSVKVKSDLYGYIVGGSATKYLPGRNEFFGLTYQFASLNNFVNNIFFHVECIYDKYPLRNFTSAILAEWREIMVRDWEFKYGDKVLGFESLVEIPRTGECYKKDGWSHVGTTKGYTCKREGGVGTDSWSGRRVWDTQNLRPKLVFCKRVN